MLLYLPLLYKWYHHTDNFLNVTHSKNFKLFLEKLVSICYHTNLIYFADYLKVS